MDEEKSIAEEVKDAVTNDEKTLGEKAPGAPFAVVGLSYIVVLGIVAIGFGVALWLFS